MTRRPTADSTARSAHAVERAGGDHGADHSAAAAARSTAAPTRPQRWDRMTREEQRARSTELAIESARSQGLPDQCEDPATYALLGRLFARGDVKVHRATARGAA